MIRFACMYCGRRIWAKDRLAGTRIPCPACGHIVHVRTPSRAKDEKALRDSVSTDTPDWRGLSDRQIARELRKHRATTGHEEKRQAMTRALSPLLPRYDSLTLFALSSAFVLLLLLEPKVPRHPLALAVPISEELGEPLARVVWSLAEHFAILVPLAGLGMVLSLLGVFYPKPKPEEVKWLMLCFAVVVTAGTGIYAGYVMLTTTRSWLMVFPAWNILNAAVPLLLFRAGLLDTEVIVDTSVRFWQVVVTLVATTVLLGVCLHLFELHWAIAYSICVGYTMSLHHAITDAFGKGEGAMERENE
ncbi:hypothetical protein [Anaerobaca lacustris]|uniref:Uncharacterized protein n=1 Tax=Anaerobaca lacustris TaxID=3044600 RepID=A0AAW6TWA2_9BACT|nr:hypothetical protein [Sedimentisphaerales bacterium M17dextr]